MRLLITWLTVDSAKDVEIIRPCRQRSPSFGMLEPLLPRGGDAFHNSFPGERLSGISAGYVYPKYSTASEWR